MGQSVVPPIAQLYLLHTLDIFVCIHSCVRFYRRYIDDIFMVVKADADASDLLKHNYLQFTSESDSDTIVFLDVRLFRDGDVLGYTLYQKPGNRYMYLPNDSDHPRHVKVAFIKAEIMRIRRNNSDPLQAARDIKLFCSRLRIRGYSWKFL